MKDLDENTVCDTWENDASAISYLLIGSICNDSNALFHAVPRCLDPATKAEYQIPLFSINLSTRDRLVQHVWTSRSSGNNITNLS